MDLRELNALLAAARKQSKLLARRQPIATVRRQLSAMVAKAGYTIEEVLGQEAVAGAAPKARRRRKLGKVAPKYRDPENRRNTWTGRGRMPTWLAYKLKYGRSIADFLIPGLARSTSHDTSKIGQKTVFKHD